MKSIVLMLLIGLLLLPISTIDAQKNQNTSGPVHFVTARDLAPAPGYSHAAVVSGGKTIFLSGQVGLNQAGEIVSRDDFRAQATQAFTNLKAVLAAAGARPENLVKLNYYVVGLNQDRLLTLREVRNRFIDQEHPPASTLTGVQALFRDDCLVEIEAVAVVP
jgi:2-iminobutanoate/2-iminopropanoate deaminase